jgi:putative transposase
MSNREFIIVALLSNGDIKLRDSLTNDIVAKPMSFLIEQLFAGNLTIKDDVDPHLEKRQAEMLNVDFTQLSDDLRAKTRRKVAYVNEVMKLKPDTLTEKDLAPIIAAVSARIEDKTPPSAINLYRWSKDVFRAGGDFRILIPRDQMKGHLGESDPRKGDARTISPEVHDIIQSVIETNYLTMERPSVASIYEDLGNSIADKNKFRSEEDKLVKCNINTVYRAIHALDPYEVTLKRFGKRIADEKYSQHGKFIKPTRPLERVEFDHTKLDLMIVDPKTRMLIGRAWLIIGEDYYTKMFWCVYVSYVPPSYLSIQQCILQGIRLKNYIRDKYPNIKHTWDAYGVPEEAIVDNAKENISDYLEDAALQIGTIIRYAFRKRPQGKGSVERTFGTLNRMLLHELPGTTFSNILDKQDYDPAKNAIIDIDTFEAILYLWIIDTYLQHPHRGINKDTPAHKWAESIKKFPPPLPSSKNDLNVLLGMIEERTIFPSGIWYENISYNDPILSPLKRSIGEKKVKIKVDPMDLSAIHVYDSFSSVWIPVPAVDQEYTRGLTLWQHKVNNKYVLEQMKQVVDMDALAQAKAAIAELVEIGWNAVKIQTRVRIARYLGVGQEKIKITDAPQSGTQRPDMRNQTPDLISMTGRGDALKGLSDIGEHVMPKNAGNDKCQVGECPDVMVGQEKPDHADITKKDVDNAQDGRKKTKLNTKGWKTAMRVKKKASHEK